MSIISLKCPACNEDVRLSFAVADGEKTSWFFCSCGTLFHQKKIDQKFFNEEYKKNFMDHKGLDERFDYLERLYVPLVQELTYGRHFLDVGFTCDNHIKSLSSKGWICDGIDLIASDHICGDFLDHKFTDKYDEQGKVVEVEKKYDFIKMGHVLGSFENPMKALYKACSLLNDKGVLLITDPDGDLANKYSVFLYGHFDAKQRWIIYSQRQMCKILGSLGFEIILARKNEEQRLMRWYDYHIIAQKKWGSK